MTRYYANHLLNGTVFADQPVGDTLPAAKRRAEEIFGDGLQEGEIVIFDSETVGYVTVASKILDKLRRPKPRWDNFPVPER